MPTTILAIAGGTASGKTTLAKAVVEHLGDKAVRICHDRYYKPLPPHLATHPDRVKLHNYDHPDALDTDLLVEHLEELKAGKTVRIPDYDFATSSRMPEHTWETVEPRLWVVVEGILILTHDRLRQIADHILFVETPDDIRLARRMKRDIVERGQKPEDVVEQYLGTVRPMHNQFVAPSARHAKMVLRGDLADGYDIPKLLDLL